MRWVNTVCSTMAVQSTSGVDAGEKTCKWREEADMDAGLDEGVIRLQDISKHVARVPSSVSSLCTDKGTNGRRFNGHPGTPIR